MKDILLSPLRDLLNLLMPEHCCGCGRELQGDERHLCTHCLAHLPLTHYSTAPSNATELRLMGRLHFVAATSLLHFAQGGIAQGIVHSIKYHDNEALGLRMGRLMGRDLLASGRFDSVELLLPVPLHPAKERRRGYNQSMLLCRGISEVCHWPIAHGAVRRTINTESQTHKQRTDRIDNIRQAFALTDAAALRGRHVLIVDDVLTTGSTISECADSVLSANDSRISIATLAIAGA